jgi:hypothetical protein
MYGTHLNQAGIKSGFTKNPANQIWGTNELGNISEANFGSSTLHHSEGFGLENRHEQPEYKVDHRRWWLVTSKIQV